MNKKNSGSQALSHKMFVPCCLRTYAFLSISLKENRKSKIMRYIFVCRRLFAGDTMSMSLQCRHIFTSAAVEFCSLKTQSHFEFFALEAVGQFFIKRPPESYSWIAHTKIGDWSMQTISFRSSQQWTIIRCSFQGKFLQESTQDCSILSLFVEIHFRRLRCLLFGTGNQNPHVSAKAEHGARTKRTDSILNQLRHFCLGNDVNRVLLMT